MEETDEDREGVSFSLRAGLIEVGGGGTVALKWRRDSGESGG